MRISRRKFIKSSGAAAGTASMLPAFVRSAAAAIAGGMLDPASIDKYVTELIIPPAMPEQYSGNQATYTISVRQFRQQMLPPDKPATTVWGYGDPGHPASFQCPGFTIEAEYNRTIQIQWRNELLDSSGNFIPHLFSVNPPTHWANPPGGVKGRDVPPGFAGTPGPYGGPVPIVTHVHGARTTEDSNGFPEAWYLPSAKNIPRAFAIAGTYFEVFNRKYYRCWEPGTATFKYHNDQPAATLWYHDNALGLADLNMYSGLTGFYLVRGGPHDLPEGILPGPAPRVGADTYGRYFEIPIAIEDRSFSQDGSLYYPTESPLISGMRASRFQYASSGRQPEFFGNTMVVNGRTWPSLDVEPRRYRFRLLNACHSRFLVLKIVTDNLARRPASAALPFWQVGAEGGFLPAPTVLDRLLIGLGERADVIIDFSRLRPGTELYVINEGPDRSFSGGKPEVDFPAADPTTTGQVMRFRVVAPASIDNSTPPDRLRLPALAALGDASNTRMLSLKTGSRGSGKPVSTLGTLSAGPLAWKDPITENPALGVTEIWEIHNFTKHAHPIHIHMAHFQVVGRQPFHGGTSIAGQNTPLGSETGFKDTVIAYPGEITRLKVRFEIAGLFAWQRHMGDHGDGQMMRPYRVWQA